MQNHNKEGSAVIFDSTYVTVDLDTIRSNITAVQRKAGVPVMAVIKADAYGHGANRVAKALEDLCSFFAVARLQEALTLRQGGIQRPILILGHTPPQNFAPAVEYDIRPTLFTLEDAQALSREAARQNKTAPFHIGVDTGMHRLGLPTTEESADICAEMAALPHVQAEGIFTHYATADCADLTAARGQAAAFERFLSMLRDRGVEIPLPHISNSAGVMNFENHYAMVRSGIITYGLYPSSEVSPGQLPVKPALSWYSTVSFVKTLPPDSPVGYGATYVTKKETVVATVAAGYADGYMRSLSNRFFVLIRGRRAPIIGRICMDQLMVDVTDIPGVTAGDRVTLLGSDGDEQITAAMLSEAAGSFPYELVSRIGHRVPRHYVLCGKPLCIDHCLLSE